MIISLVLLLIVTVLATFWSRHLANRRNRNAGAWTFVTALLPPMVLILWALPPKTVHQRQV